MLKTQESANWTRRLLEIAKILKSHKKFMVLILNDPQSEMVCHMNNEHYFQVPAIFLANLALQRLGRDAIYIYISYSDLQTVSVLDLMTGNVYNLRRLLNLESSHSAWG